MESLASPRGSSCLCIEPLPLPVALLHANVLGQINACKHKEIPYRVIIDGTSGGTPRTDTRRMTIVITPRGELLRHYWG